RPSSAFVETAPSLSVNSDWSRNRLGFSASADNYTYFSAPSQNYTNYNLALGGGYTIGRHDLNLGFAHQLAHELGTEIGAVASSVPVPYTLDDLRADYTIESGRFQFIPNLDLRHYAFGNAVILGQTVSQQYRDRNVLSGGVTTRYELSDQRAIVVVVQGSTSQFLQSMLSPLPPAAPTLPPPRPNSNTVLLLAGLDYAATGPWRYRLLAGIETRAFQASTYGTHTAPVLEGSVIYTPTGLTTVTGVVRREIEDPQSESSSGYTYTGVGVFVDHEYRRNILLQGRASFQAVDYFNNGGGSTNYSLGATVSWLLNRRLSLSASYDYVHQISSGQNQNVATASPGSLTSPSYVRNVFLLGAHLRL
ncbi:MAG: outer membrane beta-barrel protein, partial [Acetobacteraceae bacterium]|nr:outer membrane beta-barrel protein [Acetobacteraceae bacterium]